MNVSIEWIQKKMKFVKANYKGNKIKQKINEAAESGELRAFVKCDITGEMIRVHPDLVKRMRQGETLTIDEVRSKKWD